MHRRIVVLAALIAPFAAACARSSGPSAEPEPVADPAAIIAPIYQLYIARGVLVGLEDQAPWSASMREAILAMQARSRAAGEPILDFDPFIGAQDYEIAALSLTPEAIVANSHATVRARFTNLGRPTEILFDLVWQEAAWRVDNVRSEGWDLRQIATQLPG
jgi:hypothetical protein